VPRLLGAPTVLVLLFAFSVLMPSETHGWTLNPFKGNKDKAAAPAPAPAAEPLTHTPDGTGWSATIKDGKPVLGDENKEDTSEASEPGKKEKKPEKDGVKLFFDSKSTIPTHSYSIREKLVHDPQAFTQGLEMFDDGFIEGTGEYGSSQIRKTDLQGKVYSKVSNSKDDFGEGITVFGKHVLQLTWRENKAFLYDKESLNHEGGFEIDYEGWGAAHDEDTVYISDGTNKIRWITPPPKGDWKKEVKQVNLTDANGHEINEILWKTAEGIVIKIPVRLNELEVIEGELWANIWPTETIARIEIETGKLLGWVDLRGLRSDAAKVPNPYPICRMDVLNGIAVSKEDSGEIHVYVTGKCWPRMYDLLIMENSDVSIKGEVLALPAEEIKGVELTDFFQPKKIGGKSKKGSSKDEI